MYEILPDTNPTSIERKKTSNMEDIFFLVSKHPFQNIYIPTVMTKRKRIKG